MTLHWLENKQTYYEAWQDCTFVAGEPEYSPLERTTSLVRAALAWSLDILQNTRVAKTMTMTNVRNQNKNNDNSKMSEIKKNNDNGKMSENKMSTLSQLG